MPKIGDRVVILQSASDEGWTTNSSVGLTGIIYGSFEDNQYEWDDDLEDDIITGSIILWNIELETPYTDMWGFEITGDSLPEKHFEIIEHKLSGFSNFVRSNGL